VEGFDDAFAELLFEIPTVIRNVEQRGDAPCVLHSVQGTAARVALVFLSVAARPLLQGDANHVVPLRLQECSRD